MYYFNLKKLIWYLYHYYISNYLKNTNINILILVCII